MLSIAALNAEPEAATDAVAAAPGETLEAQEAGAVAAMEAALARVHAGDAEGAEVRRRRGGHVDASCARRRFRRPSRRPAARVACARSRVGPGAGVGTHPTPPLSSFQSALRAVLGLPLVAATPPPSSLATQVRAAALKNLAPLVAPRAPRAALRHYAAAASLPGGADVVTLWRMASLAGTLAAWPLARAALDAGLAAAPSHPFMLEASADLALRLGDWGRAAADARRLLVADPGHARAAAVAAGAAARGGGGEPAWPADAAAPASDPPPPPPEPFHITVAAPTWGDALVALARAAAPADGRPARARLGDAVAVSFKAATASAATTAEPADGAAPETATPTPAAPARASARLAGDDVGPPVDALAAVLPHLGPPPDGDDEPGGEPGGEAEAHAPAARGGGDAATARAVRALVTGPAAAAGLAPLAAAALDAALADPAPLPKRALLAALRLDAPTRAFERAPATALALAELHVAAASDPATTLGDDGGRRVAADHLAAAAVCLAGAGAAFAAAEAAGAGAPHADRALVARFRWTAARLAESRRAPDVAAEHYAAAAAAAGVAPRVDAVLAHAQTLLSGSPVDAAALVSPDTIAARLQALGLMQALAGGRERLAEGGAAAADALVAELAPRVLAPAGRRGRLLAGDARRQLLEAALLLQDAAAASAAAARAAGDAARAATAVRAELRARLLILSHMLPRPPPVQRDEVRHSAPADGPAPPGAADPSRAARPTLERALTGAAYTALSLAAAGPAALADALACGGAEELHAVLWRLAAHVERCFWACAAPPGLPTGPARAGGAVAPPAPRSPSPAAQAALGTATAALVALWGVDPAAPARDAAAADGLLRALGALVASRRVPAGRRAPLLRASAHVASRIVGDEAWTEEAETDPADARASLRAGLAADLCALYGADLPGRDPAWPAASGLDAGACAGELASVGDCAEAWALLRPRAAAAAADARAFARLAPALAAIEAACPEPAAGVLDAWRPEAVLDGAAGAADGALRAAARSEPADAATAAALLSIPPSLAAAVAADPASSVHAGLHAACLPLAERVAFGDGAALARGAWLSGDGDGARAATRAARGPCLALRYAPVDVAAWRALARVHGAAAEALRADAALAPPARWAADAPARDRLAALDRRAERACLIWRALAGGGIEGAAAGRARGALALARASRAPPRDPRERRGPADEAAAAAAEDAYAAAEADAPADWRAALGRGRAAEKRAAAARTPRAAALPHYARAVALSAARTGGAPAVEPLYRLHACRLKGALGELRGAAAAGRAVPPAAVAPLARFCFDAATAAKLAKVKQLNEGGDGEGGGGSDADSGDDARGGAASPPPPGPGTTAALAVADDAMAALSFIAASDKYYHKAAHRLARALVARGDARAALAALAPLVDGADGYRLATYQIAEGDVGGELGGEEVAAAAAWRPPPAPSAHPSSGGRPASLAGAGVAETWRGHARRVAAHVRLHARLAAAAGGGDALARAASFVSVRAHRDGVPGLDAASRLVAGLHFRAVVAGLREACGGLFVWPDGGEPAPPPSPGAASPGAALPLSPRGRGPRLAPRSLRPPPNDDVAAAVLRRAYDIYVSSCAPDRGAPGGWPDVAAAGDAAAGPLPPDATPWATEAAFSVAARAHAARLEAACDFSALADAAAALRKRSRAGREPTRAARSLTADVGKRAARALAAAVAGVEAAAAAGAAAERAAADAGADPASSRAAGAAAAGAAGWPPARAWPVLQGAAAARRGGAFAPSADAPADVDAILRRSYAAYVTLHHGAAVGGPPRAVGLSEAAAGADDLARAAARGGSEGGAPVPPAPTPVDAPAPPPAAGGKRSADAAGVVGGTLRAKAPAKR